MKIINEMEIKVRALSVNESFARASVAAFCVQLNPSLDEITDIKTSVSEAVTNAIVHAYPKDEKGYVTIKIQLTESMVYITVSDQGIGIPDFETAMQPFYTTKPEEERSGMGFTVMESFMDKVYLTKNNIKGLSVHMEKTIVGDRKYMACGE